MMLKRFKKFTVKTLSTLLLVFSLACVTRGDLSSGACQPPPAQLAKPEPQEESEALSPVLQRLNQHMHQALRSATRYARSDVGPLIIFEEGKMKLLKQNKEVAAFSILPPLEYQQLKVVGHVFFVTAIQLQRADLGEEERAGWVAAMRGDLGLAMKELNAIGLSPALLESQKNLLQGTLTLLDEAQKAQPSTQRLKRYINESLPLIWIGARRSASLHLEVIHAQAKRLMALLNQEERQSVRAHLYGGRGARRDNLVIQYLSWLFGEGTGRESDRIVFSENIQEHNRALDMFAKYSVESQLALFIFDDSQRLDRDLLGDVTREILSTWPEATEVVKSIPKTQ